MDAHVRIDAPPQHSAAVQIQKPVDEHFRAAVETGLERRRLAVKVQGRRETFGRPESVQYLAVLDVLLVAQLQSIDHGLAEFADADLQCAAIAHQARAVQADGVVRRMQALIGRGEQVVVVARMLEQGVECLGGYRSGSEHERHLPVDLADDFDVCAGAAPRRQVFEQIQRDIRIRSETVFAAPLDAALGDQLGNHVDAVGGQVARHVRVVAADVVALRVPHVEQGAGVQKELDDAHVLRHARAVQIGHRVERHARAEQPCHERLQEAAFELALPYRSAQAQGGENRQPQCGIAPRTPVKLIGERIGLAHT